MEEQKQKVIDSLKEGKSILVTVRRDPSIDQLAACIALTLILDELGKHGTAVFSGKIPPSLEFLNANKMLQKTPDSLQDFIISLDKAKADKLRYKVEDNVVKIYITPYRVTLTPKDLEFSQGDFNVDVIVALGVHKQDDLDEAITAHGRILHDATVISLNTDDKAEEELGSVSWVDTDSSSLSEMIAGIANDLGKDDAIDNQVATALLAGIVAETGQFGNGKTKPHTLETAAKLLAAGANQELVSSKLGRSAEEKPAEAPKTDDAKAAVADDGTTALPDLGELDLSALAQPTADEPATTDATPPIIEAAPVTDTGADKPAEAAPVEAVQKSADKPDDKPADTKQDGEKTDPKVEPAPQAARPEPVAAAQPDASRQAADKTGVATHDQPQAKASETQTSDQVKTPQPTKPAAPAQTVLSHKGVVITPPTAKDKPTPISAESPRPQAEQSESTPAVPPVTSPMGPATDGAATTSADVKVIAPPVIAAPTVVAPGAAPVSDEQAALDYLKNRRADTTSGAKVQPLHGHGQGGYLETPKIGPAIAAPSDTAQAETPQVDSTKFALTPPSMGGTLTANLPNDKVSPPLDSIVKQAAAEPPILSRSKPGIVPEPAAEQTAATDTDKAVEKAVDTSTVSTAGVIAEKPSADAKPEVPASTAVAPLAALLTPEESQPEPAATSPDETAVTVAAGDQPRIEAAMDDTPPPAPHALNQSPVADTQNTPVKPAGPLEAGLLSSEESAPAEPSKPAAAADPVSKDANKPQPVLQAGLAEPEPAAAAPAVTPASPAAPSTSGSVPLPDLQAALADVVPPTAGTPPTAPPPITAVPV